MKQNYYFTSQKTFLMALSLTWAKVAIKILSSGEISAIFQTLGEVSAIIPCTKNIKSCLKNGHVIEINMSLLHLNSHAVLVQVGYN